jgi:hypothetical protein
MADPNRQQPVSQVAAAVQKAFQPLISGLPA